MYLLGNFYIEEQNGFPLKASKFQKSSLAPLLKDLSNFWFPCLLDFKIQIHTNSYGKQEPKQE